MSARYSPASPPESECEQAAFDPQRARPLLACRPSALDWRQSGWLWRGPCACDRSAFTHTAHAHCSCEWFLPVPAINACATHAKQVTSTSDLAVADQRWQKACLRALAQGEYGQHRVDFAAGQSPPVDRSLSVGQTDVRIPSTQHRSTIYTWSKRASLFPGRGLCAVSVHWRPFPTCLRPARQEAPQAGRSRQGRLPPPSSALRSTGLPTGALCSGVFGNASRAHLAGWYGEPMGQGEGGAAPNLKPMGHTHGARRPAPYDRERIS